jgi:hypothetical protein
MKLRNLFFICAFTASPIAAMAQELYDISAHYLQNSYFDSNYDYDVSQTGNVEKELLPIEGWTEAHDADYTISGIYQIGTKKTFNGASIPATNVFGTTDGGVLALSTGWSKSLKFTQTVTLPAGNYRLVSAYYNGDASKTGGKSLLGWLPTGGTSMLSKVTSFPVGEWVTDTIVFRLTATKTGKIQMGFQAVANGSENSAKISLDYVKILRDTPYGEVDLAIYKNNLNTLIKSAESKYGTGTGRGAAALKTAIDKAKEVYESTTVTVEEINEAYDQLNEALTLYNALALADSKLKALLTTANTTANKAGGDDADELKQAIAVAQAVYDNEEATVEELNAATEALQVALDTYNYSHPTGKIPTVKTDPRFARGATMAFGRLSITMNGATIKERGFCWSEHPEPTIFDNRSTKTLTGSSVTGTIYRLPDLKPSTIYYMRAYAVTSGYQVAYGNVIKFCTIPKGQITFTMRDGGDQATYNRIKSATVLALDYWNNLTEMKGFSPNVGFVDGVPTADCSYGGWIRVGSNTSYQRCGTIMHEMLHGCGVIPWADTEWSRHNLRSGVNGDGYGTGLWLGDRVTEVVRFLQNSTTAQLNGDYQHMWPYGINGASEDNNEDALYIGCSLVCQALGEDGLQHTYSQFAEPYYAFVQENEVKYYIKNESENRGLYTAYLMPDKNGKLLWRDMTSQDAAQNDSAAWYISFTPTNQYYQFRNAATGQYITYSSGIKTVTKASPSATEDWHLMKGRVDVDGMRGFWIIHPESNWSPRCLQANINGATASEVFNIANTAEAQRWLIMTLDEMQSFESKALAKVKGQAEDVLARVKAMVAVPHTEDVEGTDQAIQSKLQELDERKAAAVSTTELNAIISEAQEAATTFLQSVTATDPAQPFDLTYMLTNPTIDENTDGWSQAATISYGCGEFYQATFDFNQTVKQLPAGTYQFCVQGFQRPGAYTTCANVPVTATIYAGNKSEKLAHIVDGGQAKRFNKGGSEVTINGKLVPNDMRAASVYFANGLYENRVAAKVANNNGSLKVGIKSSSMPNSYWVIFDNFRLYFYGKMSEDLLGIEELQADKKANQHIYTLDGQRMKDNATLRSGLYIIGGRKVVVK